MLQVDLLPTWPVYPNDGAAKTMLLANHASLEVPEIVNLIAGRVFRSKFTIKPSLVGSMLEMRENLSLTSPLSPSPKKNICLSVIAKTPEPLLFHSE